MKIFFDARVDARPLNNFISEHRHQGRVAEKVGYTGHADDPESGLTYAQARYYDPVVGRFLSPDPVRMADDFNLYAYVGNNPVNAKDPDGMYGRGTGFKDSEWKKFDSAQQRAASRAEKQAQKLDARAAKLEAGAKPKGGEISGSLRSQAGAFRGAAANLRSNGSDGKVANLTNTAGIAAAGASDPANTAAGVIGNGPVVLVNGDHSAVQQAGQGLEKIVLHESFHTYGFSDSKGSNRSKAYKDGTPAQQSSFKELNGTPAAIANPDHYVDMVY